MLIYDAEIARCIPDPLAERQPDLEYCDGWQDFKGMGISVVCAYVVETRKVRVFLEDNLGEFAELARTELLIGFNNSGFDDHLLRAAGIEFLQSYDLLTEIRRVADGSPYYVRGVTRAGRKLAQVCRANLRQENQKSGDGELAPVLWQRGRRGQVIDYCVSDVLLLAKLIAKLPRLVDPATGMELRLQHPGELMSQASTSRSPSVPKRRCSTAAERSGEVRRVLR